MPSPPGRFIRAGAAASFKNQLGNYAPARRHACFRPEFSMTGFESFYSSIDATGPAVVHIGPEGGMTDDIKLKICGHRMMIAVVGEPSGKRLGQHIRQGLAQKVLHLNMRTLIDLTRFVGVVDWDELAGVRAMAPWGEEIGHPCRTAYLLREGGAAILVKAVSALFPMGQHRAFTDRQEAVQWLEATTARPPA
jgi:hypothetical protein